jgi:hypothetical protein
MKLLQSFFLLLWFSSAVTGEANQQECVTDYDETLDYFPVKTVVEFAEQFEGSCEMIRLVQNHSLCPHEY